MRLDLLRESPSYRHRAVLSGGSPDFDRRAQILHEGNLDLPSCFIDFDEMAEMVLRRGLKEEFDLEPVELRHFSSAPNLYEYRRLCYHTLNLFFEGPMSEEPKH